MVEMALFDFYLVNNFFKTYCGLKTLKYKMYLFIFKSISQMIKLIDIMANNQNKMVFCFFPFFVSEKAVTEYVREMTNQSISIEDIGKVITIRKQFFCP